MKKYRYALSATSQFFFCGVPFRLDTAPKCTINCLYCFAMARGGRRTATNQIADPDRVLRKVNKNLELNERPIDVNGAMIHHHVPVHFGGMSDPFANSQVSKISIRLLEGLTAVNYPIVLSTKNSRMLVDDTVLGIISRKKNIAIQISLCTSDDALAGQVEPGAPSPSERINAIRLLASLEIPVIVRLQPLFPSLLQHTIEELIPKIGAAGARHVILEFIKLPVERNLSLMEEFYRCISWDDYAFFAKCGAKLVGREWVLPNEFKWSELAPVIDAIRRNGMTYGSGDYGLNHLGDTACCCGIDDLPGFTGWFDGNFSNLLRQAPEGYVSMRHLDSFWYPEGSIRTIVNSHSRIASARTFRDYLEHKWNSPGTANAPDQFLGVSWQGDFDDEGHCVYVKKDVQ